VKLLLVLTLLSPLSHAGWWSDFCSKNLVADDPYQFEGHQTEWLIKEYRRVGGTLVWRQDVAQQKYLRVLGRELKVRLLNHDEKVDEILIALEDYEWIEL
jgi:hypothetical protein